MTVEKIITEKEAAEILSVSTKTLQSWRYKGCGPTYIKFPRKIAYSVADLHAFVQKQKITPTH